MTSLAVKNRAFITDVENVSYRTYGIRVFNHPEEKQWTLFPWQVVEFVEGIPDNDLHDTS